MSKPLDWDKAKKHFDEAERAYLDLRGVPGVNVEFAIRWTFEPLAKRYNNGERTRELYDKMLAVK